MSDIQEVKFVIEITIPYESYPTKKENKMAEKSMKEYIEDFIVGEMNYIEYSTGEPIVDCSKKTKVRFLDGRSLK